MIRHYRPSRRRSRASRTFGKFLPSLALVLIGSAGFYAAMQWFRQDSEQTFAQYDVPQETAASPVEAAPTPNSQPQTPTLETERPIERSAPLSSAFDGQSTGRVNSYTTKQAAEFSVLAYLPALDMASDSYHVWLLKDGLADVKDMGQLNPRADGSWVLSFTAGSATGIADPELYKTVVITREPNDDNPGPSGNKLAEARF